MSTSGYRIFEVKWQTESSGYYHVIVKVNDKDRTRTNCEVLYRFPDSEAWKENGIIGIPIDDSYDDGSYIAIEYTKEYYPEYFV